MSCGICGSCDLPVRSRCMDCQRLMCARCETSHKDTSLPYNVVDERESPKTAGQGQKDDLRERFAAAENIPVEADGSVAQGQLMTFELAQGQSVTFDSASDSTDCLRDGQAGKSDQDSNSDDEVINQEVAANHCVSDETGSECGSEDSDWEFLTPVARPCIQDLETDPEDGYLATRCQQFSMPGLYEDITNYTYRQARCVPLSSEGNSLCEVNNQIWCTADDAIHIYTTDLQYVRSITHKTLNGMRSVVSGCHGDDYDVIVSSTGSGLHRINKKERIQIAEGEFSSVSVHKQMLYALQYKTGVVNIYSYQNQMMASVERSINLQDYKQGSNMDKLCVHGCNLYVGCFNEDTLYVYNMEGTVLRKLGTHGTGLAAEFNGLILCSVDNKGNALLLDYNNQRLQTCGHSGRFCELRIKWGEAGFPNHAYVDADTSDLFVVSCHLHQIIKYGIGLGV